MNSNVSGSGAEEEEADMRKTSSASSAACVIFVEAVSIFW